MKKSKKIFVAGTIGNTLIGLIFPFLLIFVIFVGMHYIAMWICIVLMVLAFLGTAIVANIAAGYDPKNRWCSAVIPPFAFVIPWLLIMRDLTSLADWWVLIVAFAIIAVVCALSLALTWKKQLKKQNKVADETV